MKKQNSTEIYYLANRMIKENNKAKQASSG